MKVDCRSLIALRTEAGELLPNPVYGWVSVYSSHSTQMIISPVPADHVKPVRMILKARGGYVEPAELRKMAAAGKKGPGPKVTTDRDLHNALTAEVAAEVAESEAEMAIEELEEKTRAFVEKGQKAKDAAAEGSPKKPANDGEADAVAARSVSAKGFAGLKEAKNESKADKFQAKKAMDGLKEGRNESKADAFLAKKALSGLKEGQNEAKAECKFTGGAIRLCV